MAKGAGWRRVLVILTLLAAPAVLPAQNLTIVLLGTGSPEPAMDRFGPATLVEAGGQRFLFDVGRGATQRLWQIPIRVGEIRHVFLTHLHSDHTVGLADVWLMGWLQNRFGGRSGPLQVHGPEGTAALVRSLRDAYTTDVRQRGQAGIPDSAVMINGHDVAEGIVYDRVGVRITAFTVDHGSPPLPSLGYRVDFGGKSVVISGDTRPSDNLMRFARGVDVLIHEVMAATPETQARPALGRILASHTSPEQAGSVFARVNPKLAVYTHVSLLVPPEQRPALLATLLPRTKQAWSGRVVVGEDLMTIVVGDSISVRQKSGSGPGGASR